MGSACLRQLLADPAFGRVVALTRRPLEGVPPAPKLAAHVVDFDRPDSWADLLAADTLVCALGTTIKQAGSRERFRAVDYGLPFAAAQLALARGLRHYLLVSSLGANPRSAAFYSRVKGELERDLAALPIPRLTVVRPSLLLGERKEFRLGERIAQRLAFLIPGRYAAIRAEDVAAALVRLAREDGPARRVVESGEMRVAGHRSRVTGARPSPAGSP